VDIEETQEIEVTVDGSWTRYPLWYRWDKSNALLLFTCTMELGLTPEHQVRLYPLLALANERLMLGHFDLDHTTGHVRFRRNIMLDRAAYLTAEKIETLIDAAITECDRCYPAIQAVLWQEKNAAEALKLAMFDTEGEA
jgi:hypothetical protein